MISRKVWKQVDWKKFLDEEESEDEDFEENEK